MESHRRRPDVVALDVIDLIGVQRLNGDDVELIRLGRLDVEHETDAVVEVFGERVDDSATGLGQIVGVVEPSPRPRRNAEQRLVHCFEFPSRRASLSYQRMNSPSPWALMRKFGHRLESDSNISSTERPRSAVLGRCCREV